MKNIQKTYEEWGRVKAKINNSMNYPKYFKAGQVWWCRIGENVGVEMDGKDRNFTRPVMIIRKLNEKSFFGVPLTSQKKREKPYYLPLSVAGKEGQILLNQARTWDASRLEKVMAKIDKEKFAMLKKGLLDFLSK